jgi:hypothetical protein
MCPPRSGLRGAPSLPRSVRSSGRDLSDAPPPSQPPPDKKIQIFFQNEETGEHAIKLSRTPGLTARLLVARFCHRTHIPYNPEFGVTRLLKGLDPQWIRPTEMIDDRFGRSGLRLSVRVAPDLAFQSRVDIATEGDISLVVTFQRFHFSETGQFERTIILNRSDRVQSVLREFFDRDHEHGWIPMNSLGIFYRKGGVEFEAAFPRLISAMNWEENEQLFIKTVSEFTIRGRHQTLSGRKVTFKVSRDADRNQLISNFKANCRELETVDNYHVAFVNAGGGIVQMPVDAYVVEMQRNGELGLVVVGTQPIVRDFVRLKVAKASRTLDTVELICPSQMTMREVAHLFFYGGAPAEGIAFEIWTMEKDSKRSLELKETIDAVGLDDDGQVFVDMKAAPRSRQAKRK